MRFRHFVCVPLLLATVAPLAADPAAADLAVRFALVVGNRGEAPLPEIGDVLSERLPADYLSQWDPHADNPEIRRIFALRGLSEVARQAARLPADGGELVGSVRVDESLWRIALDVRPRPNATVAVAVRISRDGELLAAPTVLTSVGERAIVTIAGTTETRLLFLVVQADRWPVAAPDPETGDEVVPPKRISHVTPDYPASEKAGGVQGLVVVAMRIDTEGRVRDARVERSLGAAFDEAALAAVRQWRFEPARRAGRAVDYDFRVTINFVPASPGD
ncbi:MAG: TonB family protein [Thermoanaerobaculia bacterium]|nr:TonB family protein [Thermoanaerobaculia bacterium]